MNRIFQLVASLAILLGSIFIPGSIAQASHFDNLQIRSFQDIKKTTPLVLQHASDLINLDQVQVQAWHSSHSSHVSHASHASHNSHNSHSSHYSSY